MRRGSGLRTPAARALVAFWGVVILGAAVGAGVLQWLGPPEGEKPPPPEVARNSEPEGRHEAAVYGPPVPELPRQATPVAPAPPKPGQPIQGPIAALMEPAAGGAPVGLPRLAADGRAPMQAYAGGVDPTDARPRVAVLFGGIGLSESDSEDAARMLPPAISLVVSPYSSKPEHLLGEIRARGHEMLLGLPMEPQNYPTDDPGNQALLVGAPGPQNAKRLDWAMSRFAGYAGVTNASDGLRGERFAASTLMGGVLQNLARRGLFYIDSGPNRPADAPAALVGRGTDMVIDEPAVRTEIDARLAALEQMARERGVAVGLASLPRPVTIERVAAWAEKLAERGVTLVPVSAVAAMPVPVQVARTR